MVGGLGLDTLGIGHFAPLVDKSRRFAEPGDIDGVADSHLGSADPADGIRWRQGGLEDAAAPSYNCPIRNDLMQTGRDKRAQSYTKPGP